MDGSLGVRGSGWRALAACVGLFVVMALYGLGCGGGASSPVQDLSAPDTSGRLTGSVYDLERGGELSGVVMLLENGLVSYSAASDGRGVYLFPAVAPGDYQLTAGRAGYATDRQSLRFMNGQSEVRDLGLRPTTLRGNLLGRVLRYDDGATPTVPLTGALVSVPLLGLTTSTDGLGRFWFQDLPSGFLRLFLTLRGFRDTEAFVDVPAQDTLQISFEMQDTAGTLRGTVRAAPGGAPLTSVLVSLADQGLSTLTAPDGSYQIDRVTSGWRTVDFQAPSHSPARLTTSVRAGEVTTLDAVLSYGFGTVQGTVRDTLSNLLQDVEVSLPMSGLTTRTDLLGRYLFDGTVRTGGFVAVGATKSGFITSGTWISLGPTDIVTVDFTLIPSVGGVTGTVLSRVSLTPVPGAVCVIPYLGVSVVTNASGVYAFSGLAPGSVPIRVSAVGYTTLTTPATVVAGAITVTDILINPVP